MKKLLLLAVAALLAVPPLTVDTTGVGVSEAEAQVRQLRRAIQQNTRLAVQRQLAKLNIKGSAGAVTAMSVSPDGRYLVSVSADLTPRIWDLKEGRQVLKLGKLGGIANVALFLPDSQSFLTADDSGTIELWSIPTEKKVRSFTGHAGPVTALSLSADGTTIASGGVDRSVRVWQAQDGKQIAMFRDLRAPIRSLSIGPTGQFLLGGGDDGVVRIWELRTGAQVQSYSGHTGVVRTVTFGRDETEFLSAGDDGSVRYWYADKPQAIRVYTGAGSAVTAMAVSPTLNRVAAGTAGGALVVWPAESAQPEKTITAHGGVVRQVAFDFGAERLVSAGDDSVTKIWDIATATMLVQLISTKGGWAAVDEDGRFDGDDRALNDVEWVTQTQALPIDNFSDDYYEPGLLHKKRLGTGDLMTAGARTIKDGILPPPTSQITLPANAATSGERLAVTIVTRDQGGGVEDVLLYHNGKIVDGAKRTDEKRTVEKDLDVVTSVFQVRPVAGVNRLNASAISSEKVLGMFAEVSVEVKVAARPPRLHVLVFGINEYSDPRLNLNYGRPDAQAIAAAFKATRGGVFGEVVVHELYDKEATRQNFYAALDRMRDTNPEDVVVIYLAAHGINLEDEWYLIPHEFSLPLTKDKLRQIGVPSADFREKMAQIEARRTFLMIDACKSGTATSAFEAEVDRRAIRRLGRSVGMHVMAATANNQQAVEVATLGHGVFTYTILAALKGEADTAPADGNVTVQEIVLFSEEKVPSLTEEHASHKQYPLTFSRGFDFTVNGPRN